MQSARRTSTNRFYVVAASLEDRFSLLNVYDVDRYTHLPSGLAARTALDGIARINKSSLGSLHD